MCLTAQRVADRLASAKTVPELTQLPFVLAVRPGARWLRRE